MGQPPVSRACTEPSTRPARWGGQQFDGAAAVRALILHQPGPLGGQPRGEAGGAPAARAGPGPGQAGGRGPAACGTPTCTWWRASCRRRDTPGGASHQIVGRVDAVGPGVAATGWPPAMRVGGGLAGLPPTAAAATVARAARTCAPTRASPATTWMAATPSTPGRGRFRAPLPEGADARQLAPCCAPGWSASARCGCRAGPGRAAGAVRVRGLGPPGAAESRCGAAARAGLHPGDAASSAGTRAGRRLGRPAEESPAAGRSHSTRRSSFAPPASSCRWRCERWRQADGWCWPAST